MSASGPSGPLVFSRTTGYNAFSLFKILESIIQFLNVLSTEYKCMGESSKFPKF